MVATETADLAWSGYRSESAPEDAGRYSLYRENDDIGASFAMVGYGISDTGEAGASESDSGVP